VPIIPPMWKAEIGRIMVPGQSRQKAYEIPLQQKELGYSGMHLSFQLQQEA
jgi:hypothetical protein